MAYRDGTGPMGEGPMTGRGMGPCNPNYNPAMDRGYGYGRGMGRGRGMGYRNTPYGAGYGAGYGRGMGYGRGYSRGYGWAPMDYDMVPGEAYRDLEARIAALEAQLNGEPAETETPEEE